MKYRCYYFDLIDKTLDVYTYDKLIIVGVFECDLSNIGKEKTCFKISSKPTFIDILVTNNVLSF